MTTYCKVRDGNWEDISIESLDGLTGNGIFNPDNKVWAISVATCEFSGVSVITTDLNTYYLAPSIDLDFVSDLEIFDTLELQS